jgi:hypothetical protein
MNPVTHQITTLLRVKDEATAVLQKYAAMLREVQERTDAVLTNMRALNRSLRPSNAALAAQRESLGLATKEAGIRADMSAAQIKQSEAMIAARRASLDLSERELALQKRMTVISGGGGSGGGRRHGWVGAANHVGSNMMWGGAGILGAAAYATQKAIDFNQTSMETAIALGSYNRTPAQRAGDMKSLQRAAMQGSEATGFFSAQDILEGLKVAATAGARPLVEKMGMGVFTQIAPALSRYMDVVGRLKGESAEGAAVEAIQLSHQYGAYTPDAINKILNAAATLAILMPDRMSTAVTASGYVAPTGINLAGIQPEAVLAFLATADQTGLGRGRAGARLKDFIEAVANRPHGKAKIAAYKSLGLAGALDANGNMSLTKTFDILGSNADRMKRQDFRDAVRVAFGAPGSVVAAIFSDPSKRAMFQANENVIGQAVKKGDLTTIQNLLKGTPGGAEATALARLNNDLIKFGEYGVPIAVKFFDTINPKLKEFGDWIDTHPQQATQLFDGLVHAGEGMLVLGGALKTLALIGGTVNALRTLYGAITAVKASSGAAAVVNSVAISLRGLAGAGAAFLASPFGKAFSLAGVVLGTTSFELTSDARKQLIDQYGYGYWKYLKGKHPGTNPYSFDPSQGDMTPQQWLRRSHPGPVAPGEGGGFGHHAYPTGRAHPTHAAVGGAQVHVGTIEINVHEVNDGRKVAQIAAEELRKLLGSGSAVRSKARTSGRIPTSGWEPPVLSALTPVGNAAALG